VGPNYHTNAVAATQPPHRKLPALSNPLAGFEMFRSGGEKKGKEEKKESE